MDPDIIYIILEMTCFFYFLENHDLTFFGILGWVGVRDIDLGFKSDQIRSGPKYGIPAASFYFGTGCRHCLCGLEEGFWNSWSYALDLIMVMVLYNIWIPVRSAGMTCNVHCAFFFLFRSALSRVTSLRSTLRFTQASTSEKAKYLLVLQMISSW